MIKLKHIHFGELERFIECATLYSGYKVVVEVAQDAEENKPLYNIGILTGGNGSEQ